jgi:hypothetical protein
MKKFDLGQMISIFANVGVIAGIVFLAIEISQNTAMMEAQMNQSRADSAQAGAHAIYNSDYLPEILSAVEQGQELDDVQAMRYRHFLRGLNRAQDNQYRQYRAGLLGEDVSRSIRSAVRGYIAESPLARERWEQVKYSYSDDYIALVDSVVEEYMADQVRQ